MICKLKSAIEVKPRLVGTHGEAENLPTPPPADAPGGVNTGNVPSGNAAPGQTDSTGGFITCAGKFGISADEIDAMNNEFSENPYGPTPDALARQRAFEGGLNQDSDPELAGTNSNSAEPVQCRDIPNNAPESFKISKYYTVASFCSHAEYRGHPVVANKGLSRAEIICNLRHLAVNIVDPITDHFRPLGWRVAISSGFRPESGDSDHNIGSAVDLLFYHRDLPGGQAKGVQLCRIQKVIDQVLKLPYTQMIGELDRLIHIACRRNGRVSNHRLFWSIKNGKPRSGDGYRHQSSLEGLPRVK